MTRRRYSRVSVWPRRPSSAPAAGDRRSPSAARSYMSRRLRPFDDPKDVRDSASAQTTLDTSSHRRAAAPSRIGSLAAARLQAARARRR
jgi:hypothetical protein